MSTFFLGFFAIFPVTLTVRSSGHRVGRFGIMAIVFKSGPECESAARSEKQASFISKLRTSTCSSAHHCGRGFTIGSVKRRAFYMLC